MRETTSNHHNRCSQLAPKAMASQKRLASIINLIAGPTTWRVAHHPASRSTPRPTLIFIA
jgi:hypothetical protein